MPKVNDRVKETSTSTGTGVFQLGGALTGFAQFSTAFTSGDQVYYCIAGQGTSEWEVGVGTVTSGTPWTLTRNTIFTSSNSNNIVNFSAGTKDVFCTIPAAAVNGASSLRTLTGAYTVVAGDNSQVIECTSGSFSIALTAAATLGVGFNVMVYNSGSGVITIDPNASETIDGATTLTLNQYDCIWLFCNGTSWLALGEPASKVIKGVGAGTQTAGSGTIVFANSNGVTFGMSGSSQITASVAAVPAVGIANSQTTHTTGTVILSGGGGAITIASTTGSKLLFSVPATSSLVAGNNITLSTNGSTVSIIGGGTGAAGVGVSAGTQSGNTGTIVFANSNGVSFGMSGSSQVTASFNQSVQPVALSGSNGSFAFSTATFGNSNGMSFYTTNGSLVGSYTVPTQSVQTQNMVSVNGSTGNISFQNGNNITFGVNASTITASASFNQSVQTQNVHNVTIGGNTAGVGAAISSGTLSLVGGNNITINQAGNALTISGPNTVAQSVQPVALSGSNGSFAFSTATFGNSNGMSFYTTNGSLVGSYTVPTQSVQPVALSGSNGSFAFSTATFGNSNGMSFYTTNGSLVGSYTVPTQSVQTQNMVSVNGSTGNISFQNGNNITFGVNASTITASASFNQSVQTQNVHNVTIAGNTAGVGAAISSGTLSLAGGNNITISQNGNALTISGPNVGGAQTGISGISGGTTQMTSGTAVFGNANNVSFGVNGNTITASASFNQSVQPVALSGSNGSFAFSTATFGNSNGMSFYTTNGSLVGSYTVPTQSVQTQNMVSVNGSTGNISFQNGNNITFGVNASTITASASFNQSVQTQNVHNVTIAGNTAGVGAAISSGTLSLAGGNNITISQNGNALTISGPNVGGAQTGISGISGGTTQMTSGTAVFSNANNVSFGVNGNTITASASFNQSVQPVALSGSNGSFAFSTATFGNSNGMSFYTTNGSLVGSYTVPTQSVQTQNMVSILGSTGNISFANGNGITFGGNASTVTASHNGLTSQSAQAISGSNGSFAFQTATFGNSNGMSFYTTNGSLVGSYTVPTQSVQPVALSGSNGSFAFSTATFGNSNGMSFYTTNGSLVGSYTVPTQSVQTQNVVVPGATNGTITSGTVIFHTSGGNVTFGTTLTNGSQLITASAPSGGGAATGSGTISGNTIGLYGSTFTTNYQSASIYALGQMFIYPMTVGGSSYMAFDVGRPQVSVIGNTQPGNTQVWTLTAAPVVHAYSGAGNLSVGLSTAGDHGTLILSGNQSNQTVGMYANSNTTQSSSGTVDARSLSFAGAGIASVGITNGSVLISVPSGGGAAGVALANSQTTYTNGTVELSVAGGAMTIDSTTGQRFRFSVPATSSVVGGNNISISSNGGTVSIIGQAPSVAATNGTITSGTVIFHTSGGNVTFGTTITNGSQLITASAPSGGGGAAISAGGSSQNTGTILFSNSNNISFGLNAGTLTASIADTDGLRRFFEPNPRVGTSYSALGVNTIYIDPFVIDRAASFNNLNMLCSIFGSAVSSSTTVTHQAGFTQAFALYSRSVTNTGATNYSASSNLVSFWSTSYSISAANSATSNSISQTFGYHTGMANSTSYGTSSFTTTTASASYTNGSFVGQKIISVPCSTTLSAGAYWMALRVSTSAAGGASSTAALKVNHLVMNNQTNGSFGDGFGIATTNYAIPIRGHGIFSTTSNAFPSSIPITQIVQHSNISRYYNFEA